MLLPSSRVDKFESLALYLLFLNHQPFSVYVFLFLFILNYFSISLDFLEIPWLKKGRDHIFHKKKPVKKCLWNNKRWTTTKQRTKEHKKNKRNEPKQNNQFRQFVINSNFNIWFDRTQLFFHQRLSWYFLFIELKIFFDFKSKIDWDSRFHSAWMYALVRFYGVA